MLLGHQNPALLWNTYRALVTKKEAEKYWKITPTYDGKDEINEAPVTAEEASTAAMARVVKKVNTKMPTQEQEADEKV